MRKHLLKDSTSEAINKKNQKKCFFCITCTLLTLYTNDNPFGTHMYSMVQHTKSIDKKFTTRWQLYIDRSKMLGSWTDTYSMEM